MTSPFNSSLIAFVREGMAKTAWWAPVGVLILHKIVMLIDLRGRTDWLLHFAGGLAIALFLWTVVPLLTPWLGAIARGWQHAIAFCGGCTVALFWDIGEFASDELLGTGVQHSLRETMLDLVNGAAGVSIMSLALVVVVARRGKSE